MTTNLRGLLITAALIASPTLAGAQTLNPLGGVVVATPGSGQNAQNYTYSCSVSGCATGTVIAAFAPTQGNALLSVTNGIYANQLQGNAALSTTNPAFTAISDGTTKVAVDATSTGLKVFLAGGASGVVNPNGSATSANSSPVVIASDQGAIPVSPTTYPATAVPITASATGTTAATTATLTNVSGHTTYICGFSIRANATAAATGNATVTGVKTATMNFTQWTAPAASGLGVTEEVFSPCIPASAVSTSIAVVSAAPGTGGVVSVSAWGYSI